MSDYIRCVGCGEQVRTSRSIDAAARRVVGYDARCPCGWSSVIRWTEPDPHTAEWVELVKALKWSTAEDFQVDRQVETWAMRARLRWFAAEAFAATGENEKAREAHNKAEEFIARLRALPKAADSLRRYREHLARRYNYSASLRPTWTSPREGRGSTPSPAHAASSPSSATNDESRK